MKKIFALTLSFTLIVSILLPMASACEMPPELTGSGLTTLSTGTPEDAIILEKMIKDGENGVNIYNASLFEEVRFRINLTYNDWDGEPPGDIDGYMLKDITIIDILPSELEYKGNPSHEPSDISADGKTITWEFYDIKDRLYDGDSIIVEFDAMVLALGTFVNNVEVSAIESCYGETRNASANATIISECDGPDCYDTRYKDVDDDGNLERAIDENNDPSDGYEVFYDPDGSSEAVLSIDGDGDGKIDHFIDINDDGLPDRYWDPDDDVLSDVEIIDVDYDGTDEWVYDSNGDGKPDRYYDPDDGQIHPYVVFTLTINIEGYGMVLKNPDGDLFLQDFVVELKASPLLGSNSDFDYWSGDLSGNNSIETIVMNENKTITAHFTEKDEEKPTVKITKPESNHLYFFNIKFKELENKTEIIGPILVKVDAESDKGIEKVEFYLDGELKETDNSAPYNWLWLFKPLGDQENFTITVIAYDTEGNTNTDSINVIRSQLIKRPIALGLAGAGLAGAGLAFLYLLRNRGTTEPDETIPVEPDDRDGVDDDTYESPDDDTTEDEQLDDSPIGKDGDEEDGLFWYIVSGLATTITAAVGLLFFRRKIYV